MGGMRMEDWHSGNGESDRFYEACMLVASFIFGALLCGLLIAKNEVRFGQSLYGTALLGNAFLLAVAVLVHERHVARILDECDLGSMECSKAMRRDTYAEYLTAVACGLQNGMCTMHFGAVVRTTHVTGLATDFGLTLGRIIAILFRRCRGVILNELDWAELEVDAQKMRVYLSLGFGFLSGVIIGAYLQAELGAYALLVPAGCTLTFGIAYTCFLALIKRSYKALRLKMLQDDVDEVDSSLERTKTYLDDLRRNSHSDDDEDSTDDETRNVTDQIQHALQVVHQVEEGVRDLASRRIARG